MVARFHHGQAEVTGFDRRRAGAGGRPRGLASRCCAGRCSAASRTCSSPTRIADGVRTAARVASLSTTNPGELARVLKLPPWKVKKAQAQSRGWSIDGLQQAIGVAAELNADVKGAAASADYALERAVRRIVDHPRRDRPRPAGPRRPLTAPRQAARRGTRRAPSREGRGLVHDRAARGRAGSEAGDAAWPSPTCGWRPGSCG